MLDLKLTQEENAIVLGTLLGDGHIQKRKTSYRAKIQHCQKNKDYVIWKYTKLKNLCLDSTQPKKIISNKNFVHYYFFLKSGLYLKKYHDLFYQQWLWTGPKKQKSVLKTMKTKIRYKKKITEKLINFLPNDPVLLAVWFMDDGHCRTNAFSGKLGTYSFSKDEHHLLQHYIFSNFGIKTNIVLASRLKNQYYLSIPGKHNNFAHFVDLIKPTVDQIPSMDYKIKNR